MTNLQGTNFSSGVMTAMGTATTMKKMAAREASQRAQQELENAREEKKLEIKKQLADAKTKTAEAFASQIENKNKNDKFNRSAKGMEYNLAMKKEKTKQLNAKNRLARIQALRSGGDINE